MQIKFKPSAVQVMQTKSPIADVTAETAAPTMKSSTKAPPTPAPTDYIGCISHGILNYIGIAHIGQCIPVHGSPPSTVNHFGCLATTLVGTLVGTPVEVGGRIEKALLWPPKVEVGGRIDKAAWLPLKNGQQTSEP